jgi:LDH2 family malate/lactate/ureidoglycolate dehydrogenase
VLILSESHARSLCQTALRDVGLSPDEADTCADCIMFATLRGLDSHGIVSILAGIAGGVARGRITPNAQIATIREGATTALLKGNGAAGPVIGARAMHMAMAKAREHGVGVVSTYNSNHYGAASFYPWLAMRDGMIGVSMCNASPSVAPFGGRSPLHGTNPIAYAVPSGVEPPIVLDIATSAAAHGQVSKAKRRGQEIPLGWAIDENGNPTTDPDAAYRGAMLPFGAHKGYGLGILVDVLTGALAGSTLGLSVRQGGADIVDPDHFGQSFFMLAIDIGQFVDLDVYKAGTDKLVRDAKSVAPADGFNEVLLPGELEHRTELKRREEGIPLYDEDWQAIVTGLRHAGLDADGLAARFAPSRA